MKNVMPSSYKSINNANLFAYPESDVIQTAISYIQNTISVIPVCQDKKPAIQWKPYQSQMMSVEDVHRNFNSAHGIAIICGKISRNIEVLDIDVKNDIQGNIHELFMNIVRKNNPVLFSKLVIAKTRNNGFHILYRCNNIQGNQVFAKEKNNHPIIESRGEGGYIVIYPTPGYSFIQNSIESIPLITNEERNFLCNIAKSLNRTNTTHTVANKTKTIVADNIFDHYNQKISIDEIESLLLSNAWKRVHEDNINIFFQRPGKSDNTTSATLRKSDKLFYVFSSSTKFDNDKAYNPAQVLSVLECENDMSKCAGLLKSLGYEVESVSVKPQKQAPEKIPLLPIDNLPVGIQNFINHCTDVYQSPRDFWAASVIAAVALAIGNKFQLDTGRYKNYPIFWICLVGNVSGGKSEPFSQLLSFFRQHDAQSYLEYKHQKKEFDEYMELAKNERKNINKPDFPSFSQYIVNDYTPEALHRIHEYNKRGIAIYRDELKGWFDDFNRYNKSGEQSNLLESWYSKPYIYNRKGSDPILIQEPIMNVFGTIQPNILPSLAYDNREDNGFLARLCFVFPDIDKKAELTNKSLSKHLLHDFFQMLSAMIYIENKETLTLNQDAQKIYKEWYNNNAMLINSEDNQYIKGVYGKLDVISLRLSIVMHALRLFANDTFENTNIITAEDIIPAIQITEYFRNTALKVYDKIFIDGKNSSFSKIDVIKYLSNNTTLSQSEIGKIFGISQQYIQRAIKK